MDSLLTAYGYTLKHADEIHATHTRLLAYVLGGGFCEMC